MIRVIRTISRRLLERILLQPILVFLILVGAIVILTVFRQLGLYIVGSVFAIVMIIVGMASISIYLFRQNRKSLPIFLFDILWVMFYTLLAFASMYTFPSTDSNFFMTDGIRTHLAFSDAFYFSATTFTTVGYGDILPHGAFRWYAITEALLGMFLFGLFISAIAKLSYDRRG